MSNSNPTLNGPANVPPMPTDPDAPIDVEWPNARFVPLNADGSMVAEAIAFQTQIHYDPTNESVRATWNFSYYIKPDANGPYLAITGHPTAKAGMLDVALDARMTEMVIPARFPVAVVDPVTGLDLSKVSLAGLSILHKIAFDTHKNEDKIREITQTLELQRAIAREEELRRQQQVDHEEEQARIERESREQRALDDAPVASSTDDPEAA